MCVCVCVCVYKQDLTLNIPKYSCSNPGKGVGLSPTPWCSSYWKRSLLVSLDYGRQLTYLYTTINIYVCVCVCVWEREREREREWESLDYVYSVNSVWWLLVFVHSIIGPSWSQRRGRDSHQASLNLCLQTSLPK